MHHTWTSNSENPNLQSSLGFWEEAMSALEIMEDLFFIERGYLNGNHFVYRAKKPVLIDTGYLADFEETGRLLSGLGIELAEVGLIVTTHCHCDHIGGNKVIQERSGCDIALHKLGKYFIDTKDDWATWWRYYQQEGAFFRCTEGLEDGSVISVGPHPFRVIHAPGHASDCIALYNPREKVLVSSDALWEHDVATVTERVEGSTAVHALKKSLEKLSQLEVRVVYPGHGKPFTDFEGALERSRKKVGSYLSNRQEIGNDLLKKILIYTLLMKKSVPEASFFPWLMNTLWFRETIDLYFDGLYEAKFDEIMGDFLDRGVVKRANDCLYTTVKP